MVLAEFDRHRRYKQMLRTRLGVQMGTTFAYGSLGVAFAGTFLDGKPFGLGQVGALAFGLVCLYLSLYYVPEGEDDGSV